MMQVQKDCALLVLGGGSGGLACARRASAVYGVKTILVEVARLGGTCVNVGCIPKKITWNAATVYSTIREAKAYGFSVRESATFDWAFFKQKRDAVVKHLNDAHEKNLAKDDVEYLKGLARFKDPHTVTVTLSDGSEMDIQAEKIVVAVGGYPNVPSIDGAEHGITSDGFFELQQQPKKAAVVGAGYIAVEMAGMLTALGTETHLFIRQSKFLRSFDPMIQDNLSAEYERLGIVIHKGSSPSRLEDLGNGQKKLYYKDASGEASAEFDSVLWAIGRSPQLSDLNLSAAGVRVNEKNHIKVDEFQNTNIPHVYALGDACDRGFELTPVAIAAGRFLAKRLFGNETSSKLEYSNIPSVIFAHPEAGSVGMTEPQARAKFSEQAVKTYTASFPDMYYAMMDLKDQVMTSYKLVCVGKEETIAGLHIVGGGSSEILQGFAVAVKMGARKADFDRCVAIHPTSAEELVTMK